jgi:hypothetical protein
MGAVMRLLEVLREQGITPRHAIEAVPTPREALLEKYRCYLRERQGLAQGTARIVLPFVDRFLAQRFPRYHRHATSWLRPALVGHFEFVEWTADGHFRYSRFVEIRDGKRPFDVQRNRKTGWWPPRLQ